MLRKYTYHEHYEKFDPSFTDATPEVFRTHLGKGMFCFVQIVNLNRIRRSLCGNNPPESHVFDWCWYDYLRMGQVRISGSWLCRRSHLAQIICLRLMFLAEVSADRCRPYPDFNTLHQCRNFEKVLEWGNRNAIHIPRDHVSRFGNEVDLPEGPWMMMDIVQLERSTS